MNEPSTPFDAPPVMAGLASDLRIASVTSEGIVIADVACRRCGYNLRVLATSALCPECGTAVAVSLQGDLLRFSDPTWLDSLQRGVNLILVGIAGTLVVIGAAIAMTLSRVSPRLIREISPLASLVPGLLMFGGTWLLTAADPSGVGEDQYGTARRVIRVALLIGLCEQVLRLGNLVVPLTFGTVILFQIAWLIASFARLVVQAAELQYLSKLARRIPDDKLSKRARFLMWAISITYGLMILLGAVRTYGTRAFGVSSGLNTAVVGFGCFSLVDVLCLLIFGVMYLFMLGRFARRFKAEAVLARQTWAANAT
jgi:hypothetical protein